MEKKYYKEKLNPQKRSAEKEKRLKDFLEKRKALKESAAPVKDKKLSKEKNLKSTPIEEYKRKIREAEIAREAKKPAGQTIDMGDMKRKMMQAKKASKPGVKSAGKLAKAIAKKGLKMVPIIGGIASALQSKDASAAIPGLDVESLGPKKGSLGSIIEDMSKSPAERKKAFIKLQKLKNKQ